MPARAAALRRRIGAAAEYARARRARRAEADRGGGGGRVRVVAGQGDDDDERGRESKRRVHHAAARTGAGNGRARRWVSRGDERGGRRAREGRRTERWFSSAAAFGVMRRMLWQRASGERRCSSNGGARRVALPFRSSAICAAGPATPGPWCPWRLSPPCSRSERSEASVAARGGGYQVKRARAIEVIYSGCKTIGVGT